MYSSMSQKRWKCHEYKGKFDFDKKPDKVVVTENKDYIPKSERPTWCIKQNRKRVPQFRCFDCRGKKCRFFAYTNADKKDYKLFYKAWGKAQDGD